MLSFECKRFFIVNESQNNQCRYFLQQVPVCCCSGEGTKRRRTSHDTSITNELELQQVVRAGSPTAGGEEEDDDEVDSLISCLEREELSYITKLRLSTKHQKCLFISETNPTVCVPLQIGVRAV